VSNGATPFEEVALASVENSNKVIDNTKGKTPIGDSTRKLATRLTSKADDIVSVIFSGAVRSRATRNTIKMSINEKVPRKSRQSTSMVTSVEFFIPGQ